MMTAIGSSVSLRLLSTLILLSGLHKSTSGFHRGACTKGGKFQNPIKDYVLKDHVIASLTVSSRLDCTFECLTNPQCVSVNFKEEGNPLHVCELNEESRKSADSSFVSRLGYTYYDSNDNGVNCGLAPGAQRFDCRESCGTPGGTTNHWHDCPTYRTGRNCELWTDDAPNFEIKFPSRSTHDYGIVDVSYENLVSFTLSLWVNPTHSGPYTLINYAVTSSLKEIDVMCKEVECVLTIKGKARKFPLGEIVTANAWFNLIITWSKEAGEWKIFVNGALRKWGRNFQTGAQLTGQGKFAIGRSQTVFGGGFNETTAFQGMLSQVNVWSKVAIEADLKNVVKKCWRGDKGDVISWREFRDSLYGQVQNAGTATCKSTVHSSAFYFHFPSTSPANFIEGPTLLQMNKFSLCFWLQTARRSIAILSYAVKDLTGVSFFTGTSGGSNWEILSSYQNTTVNPLYGNYWTHVCTTWENVNGEHNLYVDGILRFTCKQWQTGKTVPGNGTLRLGVLQSSEGIVDTSKFLFVGNLSHVNMWSRVLSPTSIEAMARGPGADSGDIMSWQSLKSKARGDVQVITDLTYDLSSRMTDYELDFGSVRSTDNYAIYENVPSMKSFTGCTWFRSGAPDGTVTLWSYSVSNNPEELSFLIDKTSSPEKHIIELCVKGSSTCRKVEFGDVNIRDGGWHFWCIVWGNRHGNWELYLNGVRKGSGSGLRQGNVVTGGGKFIVGQEQDSYGGSFGITQAMAGSITRVNLWSQQFSGNFIARIAKGADFSEGDLVPWHVFRKGIVGTLKVISPSECTLPGPTLQSLRDAYCTSKFKSHSHCSSTAKALFDKKKSKGGSRLRCYSMTSLKQDNFNNGYIYDVVKNSGCVLTLSSEIMKIVD